jgi:hypothetical protein
MQCRLILAALTPITAAVRAFDNLHSLFAGRTLVFATPLK